MIHPTDKTLGYFPLKECDLERMNYYRSLGFLPGPLFKYAKGVPKGLNAGLVGEWLNGKRKRAKWLQVRFVLDECEKLARHPQRPIIIDDDLRGEMRAHRQRTGIGGVRLLQNRDDVPDDLLGGTVGNWVNGQVTRARADHIKFVLKLWESI